MSTFICTWNDAKWDFEPGQYEEMVKRTRAGKAVRDDWSTGGRNSGVYPGDGLILLRQGVDRGIVGWGAALSTVYTEPHWDGSGRLANYVGADWQVVVPIHDRLPTEELLHRVPEV